VKWIVYTHLGQKYRIPIKKNRGPSGCCMATKEEVESAWDLSTKFGDRHMEVLGVYGDYHGQQELLKEL
jgi:hypothetical protein